MIGVLQGIAQWAPLGLPAYIFVITIVVFFHELGHFSIARACGVKVETFSIGFGPAIVSWVDRHGTRWKISWVPFGGYVKFFGDADAASMPDRRAAESMSPSDRAEAFPFKPLWQRAAVVAAGPLANFVLAIVIFALTLLFLGRVEEAPVIRTVVPHSAAADAGIMPGDVIRAVNGQSITDFGQLPEIVSLSGGESLAITLERGHRLLTVHAVPRVAVKKVLGENEREVLLGVWIAAPPVVAEVLPGSHAALAGLQPGDVIRSVDGQPVQVFDEFANLVTAATHNTVTILVARGGRLVTLHARPDKQVSTIKGATTESLQVMGVVSGPYSKPHIVSYGPIAALAGGVEQTWDIGKGTLVYLWQVASDRADASELRGPVGVAGAARQIATLGILALIQLAALMSVSIGLVNLFPIPLLDGGHLLYYACEAVLGRPLGERVQDVGFRLGLAVVLGLMILATWNDLVRLNFF